MTKNRARWRPVVMLSAALCLEASAADVECAVDGNTPIAADDRAEQVAACALHVARRAAEAPEPRGAAAEAHASLLTAVAEQARDVWREHAGDATGGDLEARSERLRAVAREADRLAAAIEDAQEEAPEPVDPCKPAYEAGFDSVFAIGESHCGVLLNLDLGKNDQDQRDLLTGAPTWVVLRQHQEKFNAHEMRAQGVDRLTRRGGYVVKLFDAEGNAARPLSDRQLDLVVSMDGETDTVPLRDSGSAFIGAGVPRGDRSLQHGDPITFDVVDSEGRSLSGERIGVFEESSGVFVDMVVAAPAVTLSLDDTASAAPVSVFPAGVTIGLETWTGRETHLRFAGLLGPQLELGDEGGVVTAMQLGFLGTVGGVELGVATPAYGSRSLFSARGERELAVIVSLTDLLLKKAGLREQDSGWELFRKSE